MWMVAMEAKQKTFYILNAFHAKILKFSFGHKDFHIAVYITKCQLLSWKQRKFK
jgi:hypothetical protein